MGKVWLQGVVRNGQVVLTAPLDLPDGVEVVVTDCYELEDDPRPQEPKSKLNDEEIAEMYLFLDHKKDWALWPEFEARMKEKYGPWLPHHYTAHAGLIDTPVLLAYREGDPDAVQFITDVRASGLPELSQVSVLVLFAWCQDASAVTGVQAFLTVATVHGVTAHTMRRAVRLMESLAPCRLTADGAIVAATAIEHSLPLYTLDPTRFAAMPGLTALQPY